MKADNLSVFQNSLVLSLFPEGTQVTEVKFFQREYLPCPIRVQVSLPNGSQHDVVLRLSRRPFGVEREANLLPILARLGLPVPKVLAGPVSDPNSEGTESTTVLSLLPGESLQTWSRTSSAGLETAAQLLIKAVDRLHQLTEPLSQEEVAKELPHKDMMSELQSVVDNAGSWIKEPLFIDSIDQLRPVVASIQTPLSFSNGDYQPGNFLSNGEDLVGFVDFESACFEDPHIGFAKYRIYDLHPLNKAGLIERYLQAHNLSEHDLAPRMAVRCLSTLQREIPVSDSNQEYGLHVLGLLQSALRRMS